MSDRLIFFLVLGFFVFSPVIPDWSEGAQANWHAVYLIWILVILIAFWFRPGAKRQQR